MDVRYISITLPCLLIASQKTYIVQDHRFHFLQRCLRFLLSEQYLLFSVKLMSSLPLMIPSSFLSALLAEL